MMWAFKFGNQENKMNILKNRFFVIGLVIVLMVGIGAAIYFQSTSAAEEAAVPALQTAKVRTGDLVITANGAGTVLPMAQADLGFRSAGVVADVAVENGAPVAGASVLARLEENLQAEADFQALFSADGLAQAKLAVANADVVLEDATNTLIYLYGTDAWYWDGQLIQAEAAFNALDAGASQSQKDQAQQAVDTARTRRDYYLTLRDIPADDFAQAHADHESAKAALADSQAALEIIKAGPEALNSAIVAQGAETARLEQARLTLENTRLVAPFDGSVTALNVVAGQTVSTSPVMTVATTERLLVRFYLDETDVSKVAAGNLVNFTFDAYPNTIVTGEVTRVEPALQIVDGTPVVVVWASLSQDAPFEILSGMSVEAEVVSAESQNTLLVPVQALRELAPGSYALFLVDTNGELKMTPVTVGLRDFANAEILSGVKVGDVVSTGTLATE